MTAALHKQIDTLWHTTNIYRHPRIYEYVEKLTAKFPGELKVIFLSIQPVNYKSTIHEFGSFQESFCFKIRLEKFICSSVLFGGFVMNINVWDAAPLDILHQYNAVYIFHLCSCLQVVYLVNSGTEANDLAILLAKAYTGNNDIVSLQSSYHGYSTTMIGLTSQKSYRMPLPVPAGIHHVRKTRDLCNHK